MKRKIDNEHSFLRGFANLCEFQQIYVPFTKFSKLAGARRRSPATLSIFAGYAVLFHQRNHDLLL